MKFGIVVWYEGRNMRLKVERVYISDQLEKYEITARNKSLAIQSNRPLIRAKGMKTRKPDYKLTAGVMQNISLVEKINDVLHQALKYQEANPVSHADYLRRTKR